MAETREWPELGEELSRKAFTVLEQALWRHGEGEEKLSDRELLIVVNTLFDTISGLVPWDVTDVIYSVRKELNLDGSKTDPRRQRRSRL